MFIDKPITVDEDDAVAFMRACRAAGVRLTGGSSCVHAEEVQRLRAAREQNEGGRTLGGIVRGPIDLESRYGGFWFYAQHVTEILCEIFGRYPTSILACERQDAITAVFRYPDYDATAFFADHSYVYAATRFSEEGNAGGVFPITGGSNCFRTEFDEFYRLLSGGEPRLPAEDLIAPVFAMSAIVRSLASGKEEPVHSFKI